MHTLCKKLSAVFLTAALLALSACGNAAPAPESAEAEPTSSSAPVSAETPAEAETQVPDAALVTIKVGATPAPHAAILKAAAEELKAHGYQLEIVEFTDYVLPNQALENGEIDANFFQHKPYLDKFNAERGTNLVSAAAIHFEPLGIYAGKTTSLDNIPDGAEIAVPNDTSNEARALELLVQLGLIELAPNSDLTSTVKDITSNPKNLTITELEAAQLPRALPDVDLAVINGNYAIEAQITDKVLASETSDSTGAQTFANIVAVRAGDEETPAIRALVQVLQSETVRQYIEETYSGLVIPVF